MTEPTKFAVALFPGFQALDAFGPLDVLNSLSNTKPISLYVLAATLDPVATKVPAGVRTGSAWPDFSQSIVPTHTFDTAPSDVEVLLIPGGYGTRDENNIKSVVEYVKRVYPSLKYLITVCTGAIVAAAAGVLEGKRATTNKAAFKHLSATIKGVEWVPKARWVVDGNIWTSSGVTAGIDAIFAWMAEVYDEETSKKIADHIEYERHTDARCDPFSEIYGLA